MTRHFLCPAMMDAGCPPSITALGAIRSHVPLIVNIYIELNMIRVQYVQLCLCVWESNMTYHHKFQLLFVFSLFKTFTVYTFIFPNKVQFIGQRGIDIRGDIAIDSVAIHRDTCRGESLPPEEITMKRSKHGNASWIIDPLHEETNGHRRIPLKRMSVIRSIDDFIVISNVTSL